MDSQPINIRTLVHHIEHLVLYSLLLWQAAIAVWLIVKWVVRNVKFTSSQVDPNITINSDNMNNGSIAENKKKVDLGPIEVDIKKNLHISNADKSDLKTDEVVKGKVKTQKDKLKKLRGKMK